MRDLKDTKSRITNSPHFKDKVVQNLEPTLKLGDRKSDDSMLKIMKKIFFDAKDPKKIPRSNDDLRTDRAEDFVVWFGHSSYLVQVGGKKFLIDPVLLGNIAPLPFIGKPFGGTEFALSEIPQIDYLIITHNHYDHLSKSSIKALSGNVERAFVPLGVGKYLKSWGISEDKITEFDWWQGVSVNGESLDSSAESNKNMESSEDFMAKNGVDSKKADSKDIADLNNADFSKNAESPKIFFLPTRHFSGRGLFDKGRTLWGSFLLIVGDKKLYFGGDSGYGVHFKMINERFGDIDLAFLENGQYNERWESVHMFPAQTLLAANDLGVKWLFPVHNSKFRISFHEWDTPMRDLSAEYERGGYNFRLLTPMIGQVVPLWGDKIELGKWWESVE